VASCLLQTALIGQGHAVHGAVPGYLKQRNESRMRKRKWKH